MRVLLISCRCLLSLLSSAICVITTKLSKNILKWIPFSIRISLLISIWIPLSTIRIPLTLASVCRRCGRRRVSLARSGPGRGKEMVVKYRKFPYNIGNCAGTRGAARDCPLQCGRERETQWNTSKLRRFLRIRRPSAARKSLSAAGRVPFGI